MPKKLPTVGEFEVEVLGHVWENEPCTERQIWDLVERRVGRTTVLKTIQRLEGNHSEIRLDRILLSSLGLRRRPCGSFHIV
jgi:hypothetical protein